MKYCVYYSPKAKSSAYEDADELIIPYNKINKDFSNILNNYSEKAIILDVSADEQLDLLDAEIWNSFAQTYPNIKIRLPRNFTYANEKIFEKILELKIPFFFDVNAYSWDTLYNLLYYSPTDIYITQELGFELDKIAEVLHEKNIKIRVYPNVAQAGGQNIPALKNFFIRPEDIPYYEPFVDVCEFYGNIDKSLTYLRIYKKDQKWFGQIKEIIIGYKGELDSRFILPAFAQTRVKCGKRCLKGRNCHMCERIEEAAETLKENNLLVKNKKS